MKGFQKNFSEILLLATMLVFVSLFAKTIENIVEDGWQNQEQNPAIVKDQEQTVPKRRLKILVHTWTNAYSHLKFQTSIADALADAGHEVVGS